MRKYLILTLIAFSFTSLSCREKKEELNIGFIFPLTGPTDYMITVKQGLDLAVNEINSEQTFGNKLIIIHYMDSKSDNETALDVFELMEKESHPDVYFSLTSTISSVLSVKAAKYKAPLICLVTSDPQITQKNIYTYSYYQTAKEEVAAIEPVILDHHMKKIGILYQDEEFGNSMMREFLEKLETSNIEINPLPYPLNDPDISGYIGELSQYDGLYLVGYRDNSLSLLEALRNIQYPGIIMGSSVFSTSDIIQLPICEGLYIGAPSIYNPNYTLIKNFSETYSKTYEEPVHHYSAIGYDIIYLLSGLLKDEEKISRDIILNKLSQEFIFPGLFGNIKKEANERAIKIPLQAAKIENVSLEYLTY
jgi:branched-chain amino acid transport system substrate-binding protein